MGISSELQKISLACHLSLCATFCTSNQSTCTIVSQQLLQPHQEVNYDLDETVKSLSHKLIERLPIQLARVAQKPRAQ